MVFGPVIGYVSQYRLIRRTKTVGNFSTDVCAILLTSNILRIFYWYADKFSVALLLQAILMIIAQILLLKLCIDTNYTQKINATSESKIVLEGSKRKFWRWNTFESYVLFLSTYSLTVGILTLLFVDFVQWKPYGGIIGLLSLSIEATLGFPQMIKNFSQKSIEGISVFLILTWFVGDLAKTIYFVFYEQPFQFVLCGCVQLTVDMIILIQLFIYRGNHLNEDIESIQVVEMAEVPQTVGETEEQL